MYIRGEESQSSHRLTYAELILLSFTKNGKRSYMDWGAIDAASSEFGEYCRASTMVKEIKREHTKPFFAALGFYLPHLPWVLSSEIMDDPDLAHIRCGGRDA